ncbi:hypothetical protein HYH03_003298 [Edaphochlamys debaryana]|uniref:Uncharacterized protein n=1 Tax=Edaphochlamys debaryana TaxID=47281 RepID=A0A835YBN2_9CHLO|nr:hypothetical protein HYH03_003298 [Edaphochlamys debaryana]|eukprot:KAG2498547.1 hypothetical protein HYH03_003298 [Edaphochlamys debaryana]
MNERAVGKLEDVVRALSLAAADYLYSELKKQGCLAATRLASSALRDLVDGSVEELRVTQAPLLNPVRVPSLARWPRCHTVIVQPRFGSEPVDAAVLLQAPFLGQLESSRRRITCVRLELDRYPRTRPGSGDSGRLESALAVSPTVCSLAGWLPCLRELDLGCLDAEEWTCGGRAAALMHAALASLGSVESLALPSVALLPGIEALAGSLRRLSVGSRLVKYREGLDEEPADEDIESVRQLLGLEELSS